MTGMKLIRSEARYRFETFNIRSIGFHNECHVALGVGEMNRKFVSCVVTASKIDLCAYKFDRG